MPHSERFAAAAQEVKAAMLHNINSITARLLGNSANRYQAVMLYILSKCSDSLPDVVCVAMLP